jgi:shikimate kinase
VRSTRDLAALPRNDLATSPLAGELESAGAFRADVSGAGPTVYGLFEDNDAAVRAAASLSSAGRTLVTRPVEAADLA